MGVISSFYIYALIAFFSFYDTIFTFICKFVW